MDPKHAQYMRLALIEAEKAGQLDEIPVGAVLVAASGQVLASACNRVITSRDPSAHAEIIAIRQAAQAIGNYRLLNTTLYATIEPCLMCMGAVVHARIKTVVFGAADPKWGAAGSLYHIARDTRLNHQPAVVSGVCAQECRSLIQDFFRTKRNSPTAGSRC